LTQNPNQALSLYTTVSSQACSFLLPPSPTFLQVGPNVIPPGRRGALRATERLPSLAPCALGRTVRSAGARW
jgi:hypothetical protein